MAKASLQRCAVSPLWKNIVSYRWPYSRNTLSYAFVHQKSVHDTFMLLAASLCFANPIVLPTLTRIPEPGVRYVQ